MELTPAKAKLYLDSCGVKCPYCGSTDISGHSLEMEAGVVTQTIDCANCNEQWSDIYTLIGIADANGNRIEPTPESKTCWVLVGTYRGLVEDVHNRFCDLQKCAIWDSSEHRCSIVSIAINTKRI